MHQTPSDILKSLLDFVYTLRRKPNEEEKNSSLFFTIIILLQINIRPIFLVLLWFGKSEYISLLIILQSFQWGLGFES